MKIIFSFIFLIFGFSSLTYITSASAADPIPTSALPGPSNPKGEPSIEDHSGDSPDTIERCSRFDEVDDGIAECVEWKTCRKAKAGEAKHFQCACKIGYSTSHPKYSPNDDFGSYLISEVSNDPNKALRNAEKACRAQFDFTIGDEDPNHWYKKFHGCDLAYICDE